jgi:Leucine-rich repeat (LRR) protein
VYADQIALEAIPFKYLDMGPKDHYEQFSEPGKTTAAEYSKAVATHIRGWMQNDVEFQLEGQFVIRSPHLDQRPEDWPAIGLAYEPTVEDATLARVATRESLKRLYLNGTKITDAGLRHLVGLKELRELSLANTPITDAGLKDLESLSALRKLDIQGTKITAEGVARLQQANPALQIKQ